ncbi:MAG: ATP-binding cassette domain-containing protein [Dehalococcoidia bacterium]|nr:ATP-binding cassette domain-containing protein [Dehalococcoidia bacterium]
MIEVKDVTKWYGPTKAVDRLSFTVQPGIVTGFLGPNGAGKTTTMRMILGLDHPSSGSVTVHGRDYASLPAPLFEVGALLDAKAIQGGRSARQHLTWVAKAGGISEDRVEQVLEAVGLADVARRKVGGFSLGMSQRLGIATALLGDPPVMLFDEPVNGLDPEGIRWVRRLFRDLAQEGRTILVSSHLMSEMEETAEHVIVIGRGRLIADASIREFTQRNGASHVRVVSPQSEELAPLLRSAGGAVAADDGALVVTGMEAPQVGQIAAEHRIVLHELAPRRVSLEAAFMALTEDSTQFQAAALDSEAIAETARALAAASPGDDSKGS